MDEAHARDCAKQAILLQLDNIDQGEQRMLVLMMMLTHVKHLKLCANNVCRLC